MTRRVVTILLEVLPVHAQRDSGDLGGGFPYGRDHGGGDRGGERFRGRLLDRLRAVRDGLGDVCRHVFVDHGLWEYQKRVRNVGRRNWDRVFGGGLILSGGCGNGLS